MPSTSPQDINWHDVQAVLVDMDGTLLDLAFDTRFWLRTLPAHISSIESIEFDHALKRVTDHGARTRGTLEWYCLDHWSDRMGVDIREVKATQSHLIKWLPGADDFLAALSVLNAERWLATNAHPFILSLKQKRLKIQQHFDRTVTSHDFNAPKETNLFWQAMQHSYGLDLSRCVMIDDSISVLDAAAHAGIGHCIEIMQPDSEFGKSEGSSSSVKPFIQIDGVAELTDGMQASSA